MVNKGIISGNKLDGAFPWNLGSPVGPVPAADIIADLPVSIGMLPNEGAVTGLAYWIGWDTFGP